jgi:hypothetical protein
MLTFFGRVTYRDHCNIALDILSQCICTFCYDSCLLVFYFNFIVATIQCIRKVAVHLQKVLEVISTFLDWKYHSEQNCIKHLHTILVLHFNRCLTNEYSETTAHFNVNFDTDNQIYVPVAESAQWLSERTVLYIFSHNGSLKVKRFATSNTCFDAKIILTSDSVIYLNGVRLGVVDRLVWLLIGINVGLLWMRWRTCGSRQMSEISWLA